MMILTLTTIVFLFCSYSAHPISKKTLNINFAPEKALVINQGEKQLFRAPMCKGEFVDKWVFTAKVYVMNVPWDSQDVGDDNWLRIRVSNGKKFVRDNSKDTNEPQPSVSTFTYSKDTWGSDDIYVEITASEGSPTYQYGLELVAVQPSPLAKIPDGMEGAVDSDEDVLKGDIATLEQIAVPFTASLMSTETGQYMIPFCFEDIYSQRTLTATTIVPEAFSDAPGGVASYFCTNGMMRNGECFRSMSVHKGLQFYDASGAKINTVVPVIEAAEYGPVYLLVLAQGNFHEQVEFTISTKLRHPATDSLKLTGRYETDIENVLTYLKVNYGNKPAHISPDYVPEEIRNEL